MPVPAEYERASAQFYDFLVDARDSAGLGSTHQAYTMVQGVLQAFRRRLTVKEALLFADALPPLLRALFVTDWNVDEPRRPFASHAVMIGEIKALRVAHNFSPDTAIDDVAAALWRHVDVAALKAVLASLPDGAEAFWQRPS